MNHFSKQVAHQTTGLKTTAFLVLKVDRPGDQYLVVFHKGRAGNMQVSL